MKLSLLRVTRAVLPSRVNATCDGPLSGAPRSTLPAAVTVLPATVKIETVPSMRLATSARVPDGLNETPDAPFPARSVARTAGGEALRSITVTRSSGIVREGSAGSIFVAAVTSAIESSGAIATLSGGPTIDVGTGSSARTFGGDTPRSMIVTVSGGGFRTVVTTPFSRVTFDSLADTTIWAAAGAGIRAAPTIAAARCLVMACEAYLQNPSTSNSQLPKREARESWVKVAAICLWRWSSTQMVRSVPFGSWELGVGS